MFVMQLELEPLEDKGNCHSEVEILDVPRMISPWRRNRLLMNIYIVLIKAKINVLLPFGPFAIALHYLTGKHVSLTDLRLSVTDAHLLCLEK